MNCKLTPEEQEIEVHAEEFESVTGYELREIPAEMRELEMTHKYGYTDNMKTTVEIPDELYRSAKAKAAESGVSFRSLLIEALRTRLHGKFEPGALDDVFGALAHERELVYEVQRAVDRDLEQVDPDEWR